MYSSLRNRSGSVGRGERDSDSPSLYKTSYGGRSNNASTSNLPRYSRASSYDPFSVGSSRTPMTSSYRNPSSSMSSSSSSYRNPSMSSSLRNSSSMSSSYSPSTTTGLSSSYHSDYKTRYGSIDQLNMSSVSSYKSPYSSRTTTENERGRLGRPTTTGSAMRSSRYLGGSVRDLSTARDTSYTPRDNSYTNTRDNSYTSARDTSYKTSLAKYRPPETVSRPSYTPSSYTSSSASRPDYRSKTPGLSLSTRDLSQSRTSRLDREYKSMTRFEKTPAREPSTEKDAVEETFQKLYNKYVRDTEVKETKPAARKFISHSEAEEDTTDDDSEISTKSLIDDKISIETTFEPVDDDKTPQGSPKKEERKDSEELTRNVSEGVKIEPKQIEKELSPVEVKEKEETKDATARFLENHPDVKMTSVVIAPRELRPASSAMDKMLRRDSLTIKLNEAIEKKKVAPVIPKANTAKLTATVSINGLTTSTGKKQDKLDTIIERSRTPNSKTPEVSPAISKESSPAVVPRIDTRPAAQITVSKVLSPGPKEVKVKSAVEPFTTQKSTIEIKHISKSVSPMPEGTKKGLRSRSRSPSMKKATSETKLVDKDDSKKPKDTVTRGRSKTPIADEVSKEKSPKWSETITIKPKLSTVETPEKSLSLRTRSPSVKKLKTPESNKKLSEDPKSKESTPIANGTVSPREKSVTPSILPKLASSSREKSPNLPEQNDPLDSESVKSTKSRSETPERSLKHRSRSPSAKKTKTQVSGELSPTSGVPSEKSVSREKSPISNGSSVSKEKSATPSTLPPIPKPSTSPKEKSPTPRILAEDKDYSPKNEANEEKRARRLRSRSSSVKRRSATPKRSDSVVEEQTEKTEKTPEKFGKLARTKLKSTADMLLTGCEPAKPKPKPPPLNLNPTTDEPSTSVTILCPPAKTRSVSPLPNHLKELNADMSCSTPGSDPDLEREERSKSVGELERKSVRKRRDPTRTLESLKESLEAELYKKFPEESGQQENKLMATSQPNVCIPPLLLVTQPSCPTTPTFPAQNEVFFEVNQDSWSDDDDEADYESDFEYSISQTFKIPDKTPLNLFSASNRGSPFGSDYDSDSSMPFLAGTRAEESRGRVDRLFAVPAPTFTCSVTYDGQESWDSDSVHSCEEEFDDAYTVGPRPGSSSLGLYLSPAEYSSDESSESADPDYDGDHFHDSVQVGFTLKLVDKAAMRESDEDDDDYYDEESEYYEEEEIEYTDEDEELWESDEYTEEEIEVEEEEESEAELEFEEVEEYSSEDEMMTVMEDMPPKFMQPSIILPSAMTASMAEEMFEFEEVEGGDFEMEGTYEMAMPMEIDREEGNAYKQREVTYTQDMEMMTHDENAEQIEKQGEQEEKAVAKRIKKDATSEKAAKLVVTQRVNQMEERVAESNVMEMEDMELLELEGEELPEMTGSSEVNVVPTYVRPQTEKVNEEMTSRFADRKPTSDFAKKAVIQPTKLETAKVEKVQTKIGEKQQPKIVEPEKLAATAKLAEKPVLPMTIPAKDTQKALEKPGATTTPIAAPSKVPSTTAPAATATTTSKPIEDKSSIRKSALNMKEEEAAKKAKADEEAAKQKARRFGTISALMSKFKDEKKEPEPITYKRSSRLEPKETERPKKKYEIVQPVINDAFDKQLEELRSQMKTGASQFQNQLKDFSKGISTVSEEAKKRELEEKHKDLLNKTSGTFSKADEEKQRWKVRRDAETEKDLAKIQADKGPSKKKVIITPQQNTAEQPKEPKRTVRKIIRQKQDPNVIVPSFATTGAEKGVTTTAPPPPPPSVPTTVPAVATPAATAVKVAEKVAPLAVAEVKVQQKTTPREKPILVRTDSFQKPSVPQPAGVINENTYDLFAAATAVATKRRKSILELKAQKEAEKQPKAAEPLSGTIERTVSPATTAIVKVPKGDRAAATKIRNALGNATNMPGVKADRTVKRYSTRRRTQEIVNESEQKKCRRKGKQRKNKFINGVQDIDVLLGWDKENTFDKMDSFILRNNQRMAQRDQVGVKRRRVENSKVWISELMDIDKIYKPSEIRDIIASVDM